MRIHILIAAICSAMLLSACGSPELTKRVKPLEIEEKKGDETFRDAQMQFTMSLLRQTVEYAADEEYLISPYLAAKAWLTAANGNAGDENTDCFGGMPLSELNRYFVKWRNTQNGLTEAQSLWISPADKNTISKDVLRLYQGLSGTSVFAAERLSEGLNQWISDATGGVVKEISAPQNSDAAMLGALTFDAIWSNTYGENEVRNVLFYDANGGQLSVPFLCKDYDSAVYIEDDAVKGLRRNCSGQKYMFLALMPKSGSPAELLGNLSAEQLTSYIRSGIDTTLRTGIPVLEADLTQDIAALMPDVGIDQIVQRVSVNIGRGTTDSIFSLQMDDSSAKPAEHIMFDHPFVYFVIDRQYGLPLIAGTVNQVS